MRGDENHANAQSWTAAYDRVHRLVEQRAPGEPGAAPSLLTRVNYDPDGNPVDVCSPRENTEGSGACTATSRFAVHTGYDRAGRAVTRTTYRDSTGPALVARFGYDPDGNQVSSTDPRGSTPDGTSVTVGAEFDLQGRRTALVTPRAGRTDYLYTAAGDRLAVAEPGVPSDNPGGPPVRVTGYRHDPQHRLLDTVTALQVPDLSPAAVRNAVTGAVSDAGTQTNLRTRLEYTADSQLSAVHPPRAFTAPDGQGSAGLVTNPDLRFTQRTEFDRANRPVARLAPRTDSSPEFTDPTGDATQAAQCRTGAANYPGGVGVCRTGWVYDAAGNITAVQLPTGLSSTDTTRVVNYTWTDDDLLETVAAPSPTGTGRVTAARNGYDGNGQVRRATNAAGHTTSIEVTADRLVSAVRGPVGPDGLTHDTLTGYNADGQAVSVTTPRTVFDTAGLVVGPQSPVTVTDYTPDGLVATVTTGRTTDGVGQGPDDTTGYSIRRGREPGGDREPGGHRGPGRAGQREQPERGRDRTDRGGGPTPTSLRADPGDRGVWFAGGGDLAGQFADAGLLDELWVQYAPWRFGR